MDTEKHALSVSIRVHPWPLMNRRGDDDAHADGHSAHQNRQRDILVLHNLFPEVVGRHLIDDDEGERENQNAESRVDHRVDQSAGMEFTHGSFTSDVSGITAVGGTIRAWVIADRLRQNLLLVNARKAPAAVLSERRKANQHGAVNQEHWIFQSSSPPELDVDGA